MLRNSLQIALCGLSVLLFVSGCTSTRPLLTGDNVGVQAILPNLKIKADQYVEYIVRRRIEKELPLYVKNIRDYNINITISEHYSDSVFTERQVTKEQVRMAARVEIFDKDYDEVASRLLDSFSTYEVCDDMPFSVAASRKQARRSVMENLAQSITLAITSSVGCGSK